MKPRIPRGTKRAAVLGRRGASERETFTLTEADLKEAKKLGDTSRRDAFQWWADLAELEQVEPLTIAWDGHSREYTARRVAA